jgi:hypothetical protein
LRAILSAVRHSPSGPPDQIRTLTSLEQELNHRLITGARRDNQCCAIAFYDSIYVSTRREQTPGRLLSGHP